jgi:hypothetical protein
MSRLSLVELSEVAVAPLLAETPILSAAAALSSVLSVAVAPLLAATPPEALLWSVLSVAVAPLSAPTPLLPSERSVELLLLVLLESV